MKKESTQTNYALLILIFIVGAGIMYVLNLTVLQKKEVDKPLSHDYAKVEKINDLYVFLESKPVDLDSYTTIEIMKGDSLIGILNSLGIGKEKFGQVLLNIANAGQENLVFYEKLTKMTEIIKNKHNDASGVIFSDKLNRCQVIKFK